MKNLVAAGFIVFATVIEMYASPETIVKPAGDLYFSDNTYTITFTLDFKNFLLNTEYIRNNTAILKTKCKNNVRMTQCGFIMSELDGLTNFIEKKQNP